MAVSKRRIVYVVGAGLSAGLGFPTIGNLLPCLWGRLVAAGLADGIAEVIRFHHPYFNPSLDSSFPTIEELLSEMKANEELFSSTRPAVGRFTSTDLVKRRADLLMEIAIWFHELKRDALRIRPAWLKTLAETMKTEQATIISFNWDLVLDELLFGSGLTKASYGFDRRAGGPFLIKPHGSLNWYRGDTARPLKNKAKFSLAGSDGNEIMAFKPLRAPKSAVGREYMPLIVPPTFSKQFEGPLFQRLWQESVRALGVASEVRFLGYSLANADFHARFVLRCGFYNQEHGALTRGALRAAATGRAKVTVVDTSPEPRDRIKAAVGWDCEFHQTTISAWVEGGGLSSGV